MTWLSKRREAINTLAAAHAAVGEVDGRGRPLEVGRPVGRAYVIQVVAECQAFVRDLYDLAAQRMVDLAQPLSQYAPLLTEAMTAGRRVDHGNADLTSMKQDFRRLGLVGLNTQLASYDHRWNQPKGRSDAAHYQELVTLWNALAHGNQGQVDLLRKEGVADTVTWARARLPGLDRMARALDRVVWEHLTTTFGVEPW